MIQTDHKRVYAIGYSTDIRKKNDSNIIVVLYYQIMKKALKIT